MIFIDPVELLTKLILAALLGALIGFEREIHDKPAGLRTHILIAIGATLFTITGLYFPGVNTNPVAVAGSIVTGLGFLGAGAIFKSENHIKGLTTAADMWVVGAIGVAVGIGLYLAALITGLLVFGVLVMHRFVKVKKMKSGQENKKARA